MAAIHDLIAQVADERLRERPAAEWARATRERKFGLVFEDHLPELLRLQINAQAVMQQLLLISTPAQLDKLFDGVH